jgi:chemotaxis signal transduction protein
MSVPSPASEAPLPRHVLPVRIGSTWYGIDALDVEEVVDLGPCVKIPRTPPQILGVLQWRARLRAVVDVAVLIEDAASVSKPETPRPRAVFVRSGDDATALPVHEVREVREVAGDDILSPRADLPWFVAVEARFDGGMMSILDLEALLDGGPQTSAPAPGAPEGPPTGAAFVVFPGVRVDYAIPAASVRSIASAADWQGAAPREVFDRPARPEGESDGDATSIARIVPATPIASAADGRPSTGRIIVVRAAGGNAALRVTGEITFLQVDPSLVLALPALVRTPDERSLVSGLAYLEGRPPLVVLDPLAMST